MLTVLGISVVALAFKAGIAFLVFLFASTTLAVACGPRLVDVEQLKTEFNRLHSETDAILTKVAGENRDMTDEEKATKEKNFARMGQITALVDDQKKMTALQAGTEFSKGNVKLPNLPNGKPAVDAEREGQPAKFDKAEFSKAVTAWGANGSFDPKFATITTATQSNVFLPREVAAPIIPTAANTFRDAVAIQAMESVTIVRTPTTAALNVPVITGTAGGQVAENAGAETDGTPGLTESIVLNVNTYQSGSVYYSNQVLAAGTVDIMNGVVPVLSYEKELGLESTIVVSIKADAGITQSVTLAAATLASITFAKMQLLNRLLPKRFDSKKVILLADDAYSQLEALVDNNGRPILAQDTQNQELKRFLGTPVLRCSYFDTMAAAKVIGAVVSLLGFRLRDVDGQNLARYDQVPAKPNQVGFNLFAYHGYGYAPSAMGLLKTP